MSSLSLNFLELLSLTLPTTTNISTWPFNALYAVLSTAVAQHPIRTLVLFARPDDLQPLISLAPSTPRIVSTEALGDLQFYDGTGITDFDFNRNMFYIVVGGLYRRTWLQHLNTAFDGMQGDVRGVFLVPQQAARRSLGMLTEHFEWCWRMGFVNSIVLLENFRRGDIEDVNGEYQAFAYTRFPTIPVLLLPSVVLDYFPQKFDNMHGYALRTPVQHDPPRVFLLSKRPGLSGLRRLKGYAATLFLAFLAQRNATLEVVQLHNSSRYELPSIIAQLNAGDVDLSINPYIPYAGVRLSYPLQLMQWCLVVPASGEIAAYAYFLRPFQTATWHLCIVALLYLSFQRALSGGLSGRTFRNAYGRALLDVLRLLMFLPLPAPAATQRRYHVQHAFGFLLVALLGFMLSNIYLALLTSFLTKLVFDTQLDSVAQLLQRSLPVLAIDYEVPLILRNAAALTPAIATLLRPRNASIWLQQLLLLQPAICDLRFLKTSQFRTC